MLSPAATFPDAPSPGLPFSSAGPCFLPDWWGELHNCDVMACPYDRTPRPTDLPRAPTHRPPTPTDPTCADLQCAASTPRSKPPPLARPTAPCHPTHPPASAFARPDRGSQRPSGRRGVMWSPMSHHSGRSRVILPTRRPAAHMRSIAVLLVMTGWSSLRRPPPNQWPEPRQPPTPPLSPQSSGTRVE